MSSAITHSLTLGYSPQLSLYFIFLPRFFSLEGKSIKKNKGQLPRQKRVTLGMGVWHCHQVEASVSAAPSVVCKQVRYTQSPTFTLELLMVSQTEH